MKIMNSNLGYPRIGAEREWKKALEAYWEGRINLNVLHAEMKRIRLSNLKMQQNSGIDLIPVSDFTYYDHMLDMAQMFDIVPSRFRTAGKEEEIYFAMARGTEEAVACEMTKWFNTNYHYIVPELSDTVPTLVRNRPLEAYREAKTELGIEGKPVIVGPYTFVKLSKHYGNRSFADWVRQFVPLYARILQELEAEGVRWVQLDEPCLVMDIPAEDMELITDVYEQLHQAAPQLHLLLQTYFEGIEHYEQVVSLPVQGIGLDFVHGYETNRANLTRWSFPQDKWLFAGIIDGRNVWAADQEQKCNLLSELLQYVTSSRLSIQPSCSLLHVPVRVSQEETLDPVIKESLAFAEEKLSEVVKLGEILQKGGQIAPLEARRQLAKSPLRNRADVQQDMAQLLSREPMRSTPFVKRAVLQQEYFGFQLLPTTTIGSFPQSSEVRQARRDWRQGKLTEETYRTFIRRKIEEWIGIQEQLQLDVFVHGEFERTDMVEFFGEKLDGIAFTQNGWVQSYGSRCVKPPLIYGDVAFVKPMTVEEVAFANTLTDKPVKGMLTGPVTILNWSFVRDDIPREQVCYQIAAALRREVTALEEAGIDVIQVDEPALREGLPLKRKRWTAYLDWAVRSFLLTISHVKDTTQIHTHMCYSEFHDMIDAISQLDADVISIETSRSHGELIQAFEDRIYDKGIGLGVYDIHSPRIPTVTEMAHMIERALRVLSPRQLWVNPDCGLKTRSKEEVVAALESMVEAACLVRGRFLKHESLVEERSE